MANNDEVPDRVEYNDSLMPHQAFWTDEDGNRWVITAWLGRVDDRIEVVGMDVRSFRHERESDLSAYLPAQDEAVKLTSSVWRSAGSLKNGLRLNYRRALIESGLLEGVEKDVASAWTAPTNRRPSTHAAVAEIYRYARSRGLKPSSEVARQLDMLESAASKRIQRARKAGYLPPAGRGRPKKPVVDGET